MDSRSGDPPVALDLFRVPGNLLICAYFPQGELHTQNIFCVPGRFHLILLSIIIFRLFQVVINMCVSHYVSTSCLPVVIPSGMAIAFFSSYFRLFSIFVPRLVCTKYLPAVFARDLTLAFLVYIFVTFFLFGIV